MNTTEKLQAIKAKCQELLTTWEGNKNHNLIYWASCGKQAEAGWRATIAAIDFMLDPKTKASGMEGYFYDLKCEIIAAWEGLV